MFPLQASPQRSASAKQGLCALVRPGQQARRVLRLVLRLGWMVPRRRVALPSYPLRSRPSLAHHVAALCVDRGLGDSGTQSWKVPVPGLQPLTMSVDRLGFVVRVVERSEGREDLGSTEVFFAIEALSCDSVLVSPAPLQARGRGHPLGMAWGEPSGSASCVRRSGM